MMLTTPKPRRWRKIAWQCDKCFGRGWFFITVLLGVKAKCKCDCCNGEGKHYAHVLR